MTIRIQDQGPMRIRYITRQSARDCTPPPRYTDRNRNLGPIPQRILKLRSS